MNLIDARRYYKTISKNIDKFDFIPPEKFLEFAEYLFRELEKNKEENKNG